MMVATINGHADRLSRILINRCQFSIPQFEG
jgi:hypothetical protein